jgi:cysteinyl-tRNA synthetase
LTYDALRRVLEHRGLKVRHVQNVTDIDDKIINRANEIGADPLQLAAGFTKSHCANWRCWMSCPPMNIRA